MIYKYEEAEGRRLLTSVGMPREFFDSFIMAQRGRDFDAVYNEIASNPEHEIVIIEDEE